jgi:hypothetical protein
MDSIAAMTIRDQPIYLRTQQQPMPDEQIDSKAASRRGCLKFSAVINARLVFIAAC